MGITDLDSLTFAMHASRGGYALLLGSGLSRSAGVMTGWEVVGDLVSRLAASRGENSGADPYEWYRSECGREPSYSEVLAGLALSPAARQQLLRSYFEPDETDREQGRKVPTRAHHAIARLAARGHVRVVITTNFDPLIESALEAAGVVPAVVSTPDQIDGMPPLRDISCLVIKPHGDYRDERIKNTPEELASYDERVARLLQRVFEDYGLVVSGWSADWDNGLRQMIERSRLRATLYWSDIKSLSEPARKLVDLKQGRVIRTDSADEFFDSLADRLTALDDFHRPHPASVELMLAQAKQYLSESKYRIRLADLVDAEIEAALQQLHDQGLFAPHGIKDEAEYMERLKAMEGPTDRLVALAATIARWALDEGSLLARIVKRLADHQSEGGITALLELRFYPALRVVYAAGVAAVGSGNYRPFAELTRVHVHGPRFDSPGNVFDKLHPYAVLATNVLKRQLNVNTPVSAWFSSSLLPSYERAVGPAADAERDLDRYEYLAALLAADLAGSETATIYFR